MVGKISKLVRTRICQGLCRQGPDSQDLSDRVEYTFFREFGMIAVVPHTHTHPKALSILFSFALAFYLANQNPFQRVAKRFSFII